MPPRQMLPAQPHVLKTILGFCGGHRTITSPCALPGGAQHRPGTQFRFINICLCEQSMQNSSPAYLPAYQVGIYQI